MNVKHVIPKYTEDGERDILIKRKYMDIQKLLYKNEKDRKNKKKEEKV